MACPDEPDTTTVDGNAPASVVVTTTTPAQNAGASAEEISRIASRVDEIETQINSGLEGNRQWTETNLSPLRQEIADLKATLAEVSGNLPQRLTEVREELIQQLQELRQKLEMQTPPSNGPLEVTPIAAVVTPPAAPPDLQEEEDGTNPTAPVRNAPPSAPARKKRVI